MCGWEVGSALVCPHLYTRGFTERLVRQHQHTYDAQDRRVYGWWGMQEPITTRHLVTAHTDQSSARRTVFVPYAQFTTADAVIVLQ